LLNLDWFFNI